jgi:hypothetical protein
MKPSSAHLSAVTAAMVLALGLVTTPALAQTAPVERRAVPPPPALRVDANATRQELMNLLEKHPPAVGRVLKLDPSLMRSESYLAGYPELRDFFAQHPEIPQNSTYYLEGVRGGFNDDYRPRNERVELAAAILAGLAAFTAAIIVLSTVVWLIKTTLEQRRWSRLSKIQAEVHSKLLDRFSANDELLTYVQTPSGRRFLESGPSPLQETAPAMGAPVSRILWSLQLGAVLLVGGLGMVFLSNSSNTLPEVAEFFYVLGAIAGAFGAGFLVSAVAAYVLSTRLGLLDRQAPRTAAQDNA